MSGQAPAGAARPSLLKAPSSRPGSGIPRATSGSTNNLATTPSTSNMVLTENTDDFIVGNRVYVGGTKPGYIQYIGETQFAPGEWAGVVLDNPIGKNDGSLNGVRYFQCEAKRGVFSRLNKLTKEPLAGAADDDDSASVKANGSVRSTSPRPGSASSRLGQTARSSTPSSHSGDGAVRLRVNDRVQVTSASGTKYGTVRYAGTTDFAVGEWAGVELDDATGKNDGSVAGKRYFTCAQKFGLFAPVHKVTKVGSARRLTSGTLSSLNQSATTPRRSTGPVRRAGSQESISTIGSASSAARGTKTRLGINSLSTAATKPSRSSATNITATQTAMQEALKEKDQHIEQLLRERDLERSELARGASQVEEVEQELTALRNEHQRYKAEAEHNVAMYREIADATDKRRKELENQLEEERKKLEDMAFRLEEESISLSEVEASKEADVEQIVILEQALLAERKRAETLEQECNTHFGREEALAKYKDEVDRLHASLHDAERTVESLQVEKSAAGEKIQQLTEELIAKITQVTVIEEQLNAKEDLGAKLNEGQAQLEKQLQENNLNLDKQEEKITELSSKLVASETTIKTINLQIGELQISCADLKRKLQASDERCEQLVSQKNQLEADIADQIKSSGNTSEQASRMNEQLREKERLLENLQLEFQTTTQERQRLEDVLEQKNNAHNQVEAAFQLSREGISALEAKLAESQAEWQKTVNGLKDELAQKNEQLTSTTQLAETQRVQLVSSMEEQSQRASILDAQIADLKRNFDDSKTVYEKTVSEAKCEIDALQAEKQQLVANISALESEKSALCERAEQLRRETQETSSAVVEKERATAALNHEVDRLTTLLLQQQTEWSSHQAELHKQLAETKQEEESARDHMRNTMESIKKDMDEQQTSLREAQDERDRWKTEAAKAAILIQRAKELEESITSLQSELRATKDQGLQEKDDLQKMLETSKIVLDQRESEMHKNRDEIDSLKNKLAVVVDTKDRMDALQQENVKYVQKVATLNGKIANLEEQLAAKQISNGDSNSEDSLLKKISEEKEALSYQVDFLNGVIVDMHKKNDELAAKIQILELEEDMLEQSPDVNLNDIKTTVALRLFCDICGTFDLHDTEDCPTQASSDSPPPSHYHGSRRQERPYCDVCEVFGHWTNECDDNETF